MHIYVNKFINKSLNHISSAGRGQQMNVYVSSYEPSTMVDNIWPLPLKSLLFIFFKLWLHFTLFLNLFAFEYMYVYTYLNIFFFTIPSYTRFIIVNVK